LGVVKKVLADNVDILDLDRVRITGYSTGGAASAVAAARYPDIFERAVAAQVCSSTLEHGVERFDQARPDGIIPSAAQPRRLKSLHLSVNGERDCIEHWSRTLKKASWLEEVPVQMNVYTAADHNTWDIVYPRMFNALFRVDPERRLDIWGTLISLILLSIASMWTRIREAATAEEESLEEMLENFDDLDSLDRTVTTNKFMLMSQKSLYGVP